MLYSERPLFLEAADVDPDRLGLLGFSQGAIAGLALLLEDPNRYAGSSRSDR